MCHVSLLCEGGHSVSCHLDTFEYHCPHRCISLPGPGSVFVCNQQREDKINKRHDTRVAAVLTISAVAFDDDYVQNREIGEWGQLQVLMLFLVLLYSLLFSSLLFSPLCSTLYAILCSSLLCTYSVLFSARLLFSLYFVLYSVLFSIPPCTLFCTAL